MKYTHVFHQLGLSENEARVYETLLSRATLPVRMISRFAETGRELTYSILDRLITLGLIEKVPGKNPVALYRAKHPREAERLVQEKKTEALRAQESFTHVFESMVASYNTAHNRPYVKFYEGLEGFRKTYEDILKSTKQVYVLRSHYDHERPEIRILIEEFIAKQTKAGIRSYVISPKLPHMSPLPYQHSEKRNISRKVLPLKRFSLSAQIIIYDDTVSITSFKTELMTTIIENKDIAQAFLVMFQFMWDSIPE